MPFPGTNIPAYSSDGYSEDVTRALRNIITEHIAELPEGLYFFFRSYSAGGSPCLTKEGRKDRGKLLPPEVLFDRYLASVGGDLAGYTSAIAPGTTIGDVAGCPVLYYAEHGMYLYELKGANGFLELWLTGDYYPPGW
ncbi:hypothetical protein [Quatrionicoccus australiensis]|uniref:hypothetical protein n=1 Tax=Quatrionicoccus australiensis TaxID=138118 RepID=UPI001CFBC5A7|nr:hypothetical protein [Quatrionicoccus australiensis]MCB4359568.1 hypothetical protein [Quatrionicoccus australiensis]